MGVVTTESAHCGVKWSAAIGVLCFIAAAASPATGQSTRRVGQPILARHVAGAMVGTAILFPLDQPLRNFLQDNQSELGRDLAIVFRQLGEVSLVFPASIGVLATGLIASETELKRSGTQMLASLSVAAGFTVVGKFVFGRARPSANEGPWSYKPFTGVFDKALPSGHTALAFAFATTLADFTDNTFPRALIYATAAATGWSRMYDDRHWLSDVGLGAIVGITSSKLVTGRWSLFGIETPDYLADPGEEPVNMGKIAVSAAAGIVLYRAVAVVASHRETAPFVAPLHDGNWGVGVRLRF